MKISVITVCYNSAATIAATLASVREQTYPDVEHIVVDGASTDETLRIVAETSGRDVIVSSETDAGIYDAMNKGLARATGDIVCFLNADDVYADREVLRSVAQEMANPDLDALYGDVEFFKPNAQHKSVRRYRSGFFTPARLAWGWMPAHPALFLRRQVYVRHGGFRTHYRIAGDFEFLVRAFGGGELRSRYVPRVLVRMQAGGASTAGLRSKILLNREVLQACRENGIKTNLAKILSKYPIKLLELFRLGR